MKLLPNKTFPHPVLGNLANDYVSRCIQVTREFRVGEDHAPVLSFSFVINEEEIDNLIKRNKAKYVVEINCPATLVRRAFCFNEKKGECVLSKGELYRKVEINAFIVATQSVPHFSSKNFNTEFGKGASFDLQPGDVLAIADTEIYYWDTEFAAPLSSVFDLVAAEEVDRGTFDIGTDADYVKIRMNPKDKSSFEQMRGSSEDKSIAMFVYFSAVVEVLHRMKNSDDTAAENKKWYRAIEYKIESSGKDLKEGDPFMLAQDLLSHPLGGILQKPN